jgi:hypothetical protein
MLSKDSEEDFRVTILHQQRDVDKFSSIYPDISLILSLQRHLLSMYGTLPLRVHQV